VYLAFFAVCSAATTPSELFSFCLFTQRSPTASVNAGLNAATALRLVLRAGAPLPAELEARLDFSSTRIFPAPTLAA
jgi:hypothetical protein